MTAPIVLRAAETREAPTDAFGGTSPVLVRHLRQHPPEDPTAGDTVLLRFPRGFRTEQLADAVPWSELLLLGGELALGEGRLLPGDYLHVPSPYQSGGPIATPDHEGAELLAVLRALASTPALDTQSSPPSTEHSALSTQSEWGYLDLRDHTDRLPLRYERTRGEATWLLRWPAGHHGLPTSATAEGLSLEVFVLSGDLSVAEVRPPFGPRDYLAFPPGSLPEPWHTRTGCDLFLRTMARLPLD